MNWTFRYATHLGYRSPQAPLFPASAGSIDPVAQIDFAADLGFAGVQYAQARSRAPDEVERVARALQRHGLESGCVVWTPFDRLRAPVLAQTGAEARATVATELAAGIETARRVGSRHLVVLGGADPTRPHGAQLAALIEHLRYASDVAGRAGITLYLETLSRKSIPGMLLQHLSDAIAVAAAVDHPALRLIFDTSHVQIMDGDLLANFDACLPWLGMVQIADNPARGEPGTGEINFDSVWRAVARSGYAGLVELEFNFLAPGAAAERAGIDNLRRLDALAAAARAAHG